MPPGNLRGAAVKDCGSISGSARCHQSRAEGRQEAVIQNQTEGGHSLSITGSSENAPCTPASPAFTLRFLLARDLHNRSFQFPKETLGIRSGSLCERTIQVTHRSSPCASCKVLRCHPMSVARPSVYSQASCHVSEQQEEDRCGFQKVASREPTCGPGLTAVGPPSSAQAWDLPGRRPLCSFLSADILKR